MELLETLETSWFLRFTTVPRRLGRYCTVTSSGVQWSELIYRALSVFTGQPRLIQDLISYFNVVEGAADKLFLASSCLVVIGHARLEVLPAKAEAVTNATTIIIVVTVENVGSADDGLPILSKIRDRFNPSGAGLTKFVTAYW